MSHIEENVRAAYDRHNRDVAEVKVLLERKKCFHIDTFRYIREMLTENLFDTLNTIAKESDPKSVASAARAVANDKEWHDPLNEWADKHSDE